MAIPSLAGIMPATPAVPGIRFESGNPFLEGYAQTDRLMNQQAEEARARQRAEQLLWQFEQLREKAMTARAIDDAAREAFGGAGMPMPAGVPTAMPSPVAPGGPPPAMPAAPPPTDTSYTTAPVPDRTIDPSFDPVRYQNAIIGLESGGNPTARNPRSSATGLGQFIDSTWLAVAPVVAQRLGQDLTGMPREQVLALRNDPEWSKAAIQVYADQNRTQMERALGHKVGEGHLGLAHGFGAQGAVGVLQADPATVADQHFPPKVIDANPHLRGKTLADIMRQYGITVPNAPGAVPSMIGRVATPEQQAAMAPVRNSPAGRALETHDWRRETTAQPGATSGGIDALFQRYTNPAMQDYRRRLAGIPGAGAELMKSYTSEFGDRDKFGIQAFELAAKGQPDMARMVAQAAGLNIDPRVFGNRDLSGKAFDVLKTLAGQDPAYVAKVMQQVMRGVPMAQAMEAAGAPKSWREQYYGGRTGGSAAAPFQFINRSDGALVRVNKATGQHEVVIEPGRPDQARARAANAAALAVKNGNIQPQQMPLYMSVMERALMGDQQALIDLQEMLAPPQAPADPRSVWERTAPGFLGGQPAPTPPPPPRLGQPAAPLATPPAAAPQANDPLGLR